MESVKLLNTEELAKLLGMKKSAVVYLKKISDIPRLKIGKRYYYIEQNVLAWLEQQEKKATPSFDD